MHPCARKSNLELMFSCLDPGFVVSVWFPFPIIPKIHFLPIPSNITIKNYSSLSTKLIWSCFSIFKHISTFCIKSSKQTVNLKFREWIRKERIKTSSNELNTPNYMSLPCLSNVESYLVPHIIILKKSLCFYCTGIDHS